MAKDSAQEVQELKQRIRFLEEENSRLNRLCHQINFLEHEAQYRSLIDQAMDSIFVFDSANGRMLDVNASACSNLGYNRSELLELSIQEITMNSSADYFNQLVERLKDAGMIVAESLYKRKDGSVFPVETHLSMILLNGVVCTLAMSHDITNRKGAEDKLNQAHALLTGLLNGIPDLIFYKDPQGKYLGCNQAFCEFVGKSSPEQVIGLSDFEMLDKKRAALFHEEDMAVIEQKSTRRKEGWVKRPDGAKMLLDTIKIPYYGQDRQLFGIIGVSRDITEQREVEEQLLQTQKMDSIGTLVGGIAHDFNNMLAGMMGNLYLIENDETLSEQGKWKARRMNDLCERAANMISQLLTFARKGMIQMQAIEFLPFLEEALLLSELSVPENVRLVRDFDCDEHACVFGDMVQLQQLLLNLLVNARDAVAKAEDPYVRVSLSKIDRQAELDIHHPGLGAGPWFSLCVEDNGCGIPKEVQGQMFEPFFTTKGVGEGTGLGLSTVYGVVRSHQGAIEVDSKPGKGTRFTIYLPIQADTLSEAMDDYDELPKGNGQTILLADDEEIVLTTTSALLQHLGYNVLQASNGFEAIETARSHHVDLALLDIVMPEIGGFDAAQSIRGHKPDLPIIFSTAYDEKKLTDQHHLPPNSCVLNKPFRLKAISTVIHSCFSEETLSSSPSAAEE